MSLMGLHLVPGIFQVPFWYVSTSHHSFGGSWGNCLLFDSQGKLCHKSLSMLSLSLTLGSQTHQSGQSTLSPATKKKKLKKNLKDLLPLGRIHNLVSVVPSAQLSGVLWYFVIDMGLLRSPQQIWLNISSTD